ncbi:outer membrane lipid asymmetry maintenance protein MlaD [Permianibacter sp. IMCC34836]|uniref:outer membrane lipid asymmetry maintenance protein MlaD n=1 Tax=Permianibacter fluminis TaxID=2738515 RepID=UPI001555D514|nr:outer membrane lipid asymmetry maintenance protein MlaD [Permianibacter fluminis]NQD39031.1 outer membrane lipid asymmetry maintenance protein MlaD [Permianibacter fluminis]
MDMRRIEILVGVFVVAGLAAMLALALKISSINRMTGDTTYRVYAKFENIGGLKVRSPVKVGGVVVGRIATIRLDQQSLTPVVEMAISTEYSQFPIDTSAKINTAGLLGEQYIALSPGGEDNILHDGDSVTETQSALVLEELISKYLFADKKPE